MNYINRSMLKITRILSSPRVAFLFIVLIVLQFSLLPWVSSALRSGADYNKYTDYSYFYVMSSYTLIVIGIVIFNANKLELFSDHFSLWVIVLSCFFRVSLGGHYALIYRLYLALLGVLLSLYIISNRENFKTPSLRPFLAGVLWSIVTIILIALSQVLLNFIPISFLPSNLSTTILNTFLYNISFGTIIEEAFFRGLIVGFMLLNGYRENIAFAVQAILFWLEHYYLASTSPVLFFIAIPLLTLSTTLIVKKYKSIFLSIVVHTSVNVFTSIVVYSLHATWMS